MNRPLLLFCLIIASSCTSRQPVDLLITHATVYTVDSAFSIAEAVAIKDGRIVATGTTKDMAAIYSAKETIDASGRFVYPGFIDAHAHFFRYGIGLQSVNLVSTSSGEEIVHKLDSAGKQGDSTSWLLGKGWDQNDWPVKEYPDKRLLDARFPNRPVFLSRIDGH